MHKLASVIVLSTALFTTACKKKGGGSSDALAKLTETTEKVCAAKDLPSATKIQEDYAKWSQEWAKKNAGDGKAVESSEAEQKAFADETKKLSDCYQKLAASGGGSAAPPSTGDKPADGSAAPAPPADKSADKPADGSAAPAATGDKPADGSAAPAASGDKPAEPATK